MDLYIRQESNIPKYRQIAESLTEHIGSGRLKVGDKLPSINDVSRNNGIAKETVVRAYKQLQKSGLILSSSKKGFYVQTNITGQRWRVLVLFNVMSPSKEIIYKNILATLKDQAHVELFFHNYNEEMFENIIRSKAGQFHYFIVMPPNSRRAAEILKTLPPQRLVILDTPLRRPLPGVSSVHQHFKEDVYEVLTENKARILKYRRIVLLSQGDKALSAAIYNGIKKFGTRNGIAVSVAETINRRLMRRGTLFITLTDDLLISCIEQQQESGLKLGRDIGIISYNENPLKRILAGGIATLSSDFEQMGKTAASFIINGTVEVVRNPFYLIVRKSL